MPKSNPIAVNPLATLDIVCRKRIRKEESSHYLVIQPSTSYLRRGVFPVDSKRNGTSGILLEIQWFCISYKLQLPSIHTLHNTNIEGMMLKKSLSKVSLRNLVKIILCYFENASFTLVTVVLNNDMFVVAHFAGFSRDSDRLINRPHRSIAKQQLESMFSFRQWKTTTSC